MRQLLGLAVAWGVLSPGGTISQADDRYRLGPWTEVPPVARGPASRPGAVQTDGRIVNARGRGSWLGDLSLYDNDDPVPAPLSLAPVALHDVPRSPVPAAPASCPCPAARTGP